MLQAVPLQVEALHALLKRANSSWTHKEVLQACLSVESEIETKHPYLLYTAVHTAVHAAFADRLGVTPPDPEASTAFAGSIAHWPVFPDTIDTLARLKKRYKLAVLLNVDNASFHAAGLRATRRSLTL